LKEGSKVPRRGNVPKRDVLPDPLYNSKLVTKLVNSIMLDGKKGVSQKVVYGAFDIVREKTGREPLEVFTEAMENIMPSLEVKARRVGGATYQVPMEVRPERRQTLGLRWITKYARARSEKTMRERLAGEIMDACNNLGGAVKKREERTRHSRTTAINLRSVLRFERRAICLENIPWKEPEISASWRTSTPVKPLPPSVFCTTPV